MILIFNLKKKKGMFGDLNGYLVISKAAVTIYK